MYDRTGPSTKCTLIKTGFKSLRTGTEAKIRPFVDALFRNMKHNCDCKHTQPHTSELYCSCSFFSRRERYALNLKSSRLLWHSLVSKVTHTNRYNGHNIMYSSEIYERQPGKELVGRSSSLKCSMLVGYVKQSRTISVSIPAKFLFL